MSRLTIPEFAPTEASSRDNRDDAQLSTASRFLNSRRLKQAIADSDPFTVQNRLTIPEFAPTEASQGRQDSSGACSRLTIPEFAPTEAADWTHLGAATLDRLTIPEFAPTEATVKPLEICEESGPPHDS